MQSRLHILQTPRQGNCLGALDERALLRSSPKGFTTMPKKQSEFLCSGYKIQLIHPSSFAITLGIQVGVDSSP